MATGLEALKEVKEKIEAQEEARVLRVGNATSVKELGKSIFATYSKEKQDEVCVRAIGAGALSQALKAIIISGTFLASKGVTPVVYPRFKDLKEEQTKEDGTTTSQVTAIELVVKFKKSE